MSTRILIIGGYGNFGGLIARRLSREAGISLTIAGRSEQKAREVAGPIQAEALAIEVPHTLEAGFASARPHIVIHTSGPFQTQSYDVAEACIRHQCHYVDLADGRNFVTNIVRLNPVAEAAGIAVISGASTVPALTSAIIDQYRSKFLTLESIEYGIATAQRPNLGLATTRSVLSYAGKPFQTLIGGQMKQVYGWQDLRWRKFRELGWRALGNCDVPDLDLFPRRYPELKTIRFQAGLELPVIHLSLWALTGLIRMGLLSNLAAAAPTLLSLSRLFDAAGSDVSGFYMELKGRDPGGHDKQITVELTAKSGCGPMIPCAPAIVATLQLARGEIVKRGATACVGLVDLGAILNELRRLDIEESVTDTTPVGDSHKQVDHSQ